MSGGSGPTTVTNTSSTNAPWGPAQPALQQSITNAQNLYNQGVGAQPYTGSTVVPYANQTIQSMNALEGIAGGAQPAFDANFNRVAANAAQGGLNQLQQGAVSQLQPMAQGDMLVRNNPFTEAVVDRSAEQMAHRVNEAMSGAGRFGSGAHQGTLAREIGDMSNRAYMQDYNRERGYQQDAIGSLFNAGQQQQANINAATGALQGALAGQTAPAGLLGQVGGAYEDLATRQLNDQLRVWNESQNLPWENLARLNAIASGAGTLGGTQNQTAQGTTNNPNMGLGLGLSALGLLGQSGGLGGLLF